MNVRPLHWQVHGSGLTIYRHPSPLAVLNVVAMSLALVNKLGECAVRAAFRALRLSFAQSAFEEMAGRSNEIHTALGLGGSEEPQDGGA